jgi:hypothetical protein
MTNHSYFNDSCETTDFFAGTDVDERRSERSELMVLARDLFSRGSILAALLILPIRGGGNKGHTTCTWSSTDRCTCCQ